MLRLYFSMRALLVTLLLAFVFSGMSFARNLLPEHVAVVYNEDSSRSKECAMLYADLRKIPKENVIALDVPMQWHDVTMEQYVQYLQNPLIKAGKQRDMHFPASRGDGLRPIYAMVLMPDLPVRIKNAPPAKLKEGEKQKSVMQRLHETIASSVDSELSLLGKSHVKRSSYIRNPAFTQDDHLVMGGFKMLSVCRLDSPLEYITKYMIQSGLKVEQAGGLKGWTVVDMGGPYASGDKMMAAAAQSAYDYGLPLLTDSLRATLPPHYPMPKPCVAYFGWYEGSANGPFRAVPDKNIPSDIEPFSFAAGAIAVHLHSFSATNIRQGRRGWVGALCGKGAAVTAGNVWEPFLSGTLRVDIFYARLLKGYCVAEAAAMATPYLSWQGIVIGDPLYRPFPKKPKPAAADSFMRAAKSLFKKDYAAAKKGFIRARDHSDDQDLRLRANLCLVQLYMLTNKKAEAKALLETLIDTYKNSNYIYSVKVLKDRYFKEIKK